MSRRGRRPGPAGVNGRPGTPPTQLGQGLLRDLKRLDRHVFGRIPSMSALNAGTCTARSETWKPKKGVVGPRIDITDARARPFLLDPKKSPTFARIWRQASNLNVGLQWSEGLLGPDDKAGYVPRWNRIVIRKAEFFAKKPPASTRRSVTHELVHAVQNRDMAAYAFRTCASLKQRVRYLDRRALKLKMRQFMAHKWKNELQAETLAWTAWFEVHDQPGMGGSRASRVAKKVARFRSTRDDYYRSFEGRWRRALGRSILD